MLRESQNEQNKLQKQSLLEKAGIIGQFRYGIDWGPLPFPKVIAFEAYFVHFDFLLASVLNIWIGNDVGDV